MPGKNRSYNVLLIEDDPYARDVMMMLLVRDWRTKIVGEVTSARTLTHWLKTRDPQQPVDFVLIDAERPGKDSWAFERIAQVQQALPNAHLLLTGTHAHRPTLARALATAGCRGYILNSEIIYALAWAVAAAGSGRWVTTPGIVAEARRARLALPPATLVLDGRDVFAGFTPRQCDVARLAVLFNLRRADIHDELGVSEKQINQYVSDLYKLLALDDMLAGTPDPAEIFNQHGFDNPLVVKRFRAAIAAERTGKGKGAREKATLAFHLLTVPEINDLADS